MITCTNLKCKYRNKKDKCTNKKVILNYWNVATFNMGHKDFLECKSFEYNEEYLNLQNKIEKLLKENKQ